MLDTAIRARDIKEIKQIKASKTKELNEKIRKKVDPSDVFVGITTGKFGQVSIIHYAWFISLKED